MSSSTNVCLYCSEAFFGRPNKKFCSESHKNQYHNENRGVARPQPVALPPVAPARGVTVPRATPPVPVPRRTPWPEAAPEPDAYEAENDWLAREEEEAAAEERAVLAKALHQQYSALVVKALKANGVVLDEDELDTWIDKFDEAAEAYRDHPALRQAQNRVHERLDDLYWLRDKFQSLLDESIKQASLWFSDEESVCFELSPKRLARFREHLLY